MLQNTENIYSPAKFVNFYIFVIRGEKVTIFAAISAQKW